MTEGDFRPLHVLIDDPDDKIDLAGGGLERDDAVDETDGERHLSALNTLWFVCPSTAAGLPDEDRERLGRIMLAQNVRSSTVFPTALKS